MSEGVAASTLRSPPQRAPTAPPSGPSTSAVHFGVDTRSLPAGAPSFPTATRKEFALRLEAQRLEPLSSLSADAWCFTPPIIDLAAVLPTILEGDEWAADARLVTNERAQPVGVHPRGSIPSSKPVAGSRTEAPACGGGASAEAEGPRTTARLAASRRLTRK